MAKNQSEKQVEKQDVVKPLEQDIKTLELTRLQLNQQLTDMQASLENITVSLNQTDGALRALQRAVQHIQQDSKDGI